MSELDLEGSRGGVARGSRAALPYTNRLEAFMDRSPALAFALLTAFYLIVVSALSSMKLLWLDELITLHIARLGSVGAIWGALARGADPNPPITHILVHFSREFFGDHELAYRLPALAGYWVGLLSLFIYLLRRVPATWAMAGAVISMAMAAFDYSYESRSYGIFYGLAMLAMLCWSITVDPVARKAIRQLTLLGMVLALTAGISTNYFAVLALFPIAAGELTRTVRKLTSIRRESTQRPSLVAILRAIDFRIWLGLAIAGSSLLLYQSMISHAIAQFSPYAWNKVSLDQVFDAYTEMVEIILYPILGLFLLAIAVLFMRREIAPDCQACRASLRRRWIGSIIFPGASRLTVPAHEIAAIFGFMVYPMLGYIVASIRGGMLSPRFVIPVCLGFAIAATFVAFYLFGQLRYAGAAMLCFCAAWFIARESVIGYWYEEQKQAFYKIVDRLPQAELHVPSNTPIVIPDPLLALTFRHYAPEFADRVVFPVDFPAIRTYRHDDSPEENLWAGRNSLYTMQIVPIATFQHAAAKYLLIADDGNWMIQDLRTHHYPVRRLHVDTRAQPIGGFTPLAHGVPSFFTSVGDSAPPAELLPAVRPPKPFRVADNLPESKFVIPDETAQE